MTTAAVQKKETNQQKLDWIFNNFYCPVCRADGGLSHSYTCSVCDTSFSQDFNAINFISPSMRDNFSITPTKNISAHRYDPIAMNIINSGGMVLDCGSGAKDVSLPNLIQSEIVDYEHVDVLAVNQLLPFKDECFDAVLSLAVLEHVDQPFDCAEEIVRVLKPGGKLYVGVPFLQREHGYPHHYFGMTRMGLRRLFAGRVDIQKHYVPKSGHPIWALWMMLQTYRDGLSGVDKKTFESMTVSDFLSKKPKDFLNETWITSLDDEAKWKIATTTMMIATKK